MLHEGLENCGSGSSGAILGGSANLSFHAIHRLVLAGAETEIFRSQRGHSCQYYLHVEFIWQARFREE